MSEWLFVQVIITVANAKLIQLFLQSKGLGPDGDQSLLNINGQVSLLKQIRPHCDTI
jgi:hypothetical protein